ncbi:hypothetical protein DEA8626_03351 [Defluviimonas aquaemixtae]|uniref:Uncharacterized protein n=1 Tax=Albidovulum aquaemixtae TaxID=1542388 RepID=A0A2R8BLN5_9RHOB|nr:hypothetical protein [Defluviimonas aquaemixtae]SPH24301.1 hypothetical protein DEA8626_03351 [Defluviimonas aquaemixtae]
MRDRRSSAGPGSVAGPFARLLRSAAGALSRLADRLGTAAADLPAGRHGGRPPEHWLQLVRKHAPQLLDDADAEGSETAALATGRQEERAPGLTSGRKHDAAAEIPARDTDAPRRRPSPASDARGSAREEGRARQQTGAGRLLLPSREARDRPPPTVAERPAAPPPAQFPRPTLAWSDLPPAPRPAPSQAEPSEDGAPAAPPGLPPSDRRSAASTPLRPTGPAPDRPGADWGSDRWPDLPAGIVRRATPEAVADQRDRLAALIREQRS